VIENGNDVMGIMDSTCERDISRSLLSLYILKEELSNFLGILFHYILYLVVGQP
jgi:hypothetical protein